MENETTRPIDEITESQYQEAKVSLKNSFLTLEKEKESIDQQRKLIRAYENQIICQNILNKTDIKIGSVKFNPVTIDDYCKQLDEIDYSSTKIEYKESEIKVPIENNIADFVQSVKDGNKKEVIQNIFEKLEKNDDNSFEHVDNFLENLANKIEDPLEVPTEYEIKNKEFLYKKQILLTQYKNALSLKDYFKNEYNKFLKEEPIPTKEDKERIVLRMKNSNKTNATIDNEPGMEEIFKDVLGNEYENFEINQNI